MHNFPGKVSEGENRRCFSATLIFTSPAFPLAKFTNLSEKRSTFLQVHPETLPHSPHSSDLNAEKNSDLKAILVRLKSSGTMESNGGNSSSHENQPSGGSNNSSKEKPTEKEIFVNHAEIAWHERRREWIGDQSKKSRRAPYEPIMSWTTTYEDLLLSTEPFPRPIPLAEMVDFLVDIWNEDGLYD